MNFGDRVSEVVGVFRVKIEDTNAAEQYEDDDEPTHAILFQRDQIELEEVDEDLEVWLETAEEEEEDEDLVLCGYHPVDDDTQVERLFYYRKSENGRVVYSLDVDGTAVPETLETFCESFACFEPTADDQ